MRQRIHDLRTRQADEGFTLIELLIVIVVLGILAGIVVFGVGAFRAQAETGVCKADVKTVQVAVDAFNASNDAFPADVAALVDAKYLKATPATTITITNGVAAANPAC
jgi:general secretion pathway protein G